MEGYIIAVIFLIYSLVQTLFSDRMEHHSLKKKQRQGRKHQIAKRKHQSKLDRIRMKDRYKESQYKEKLWLKHKKNIAGLLSSERKAKERRLLNTDRMKAKEIRARQKAADKLKAKESRAKQKASDKRKSKELKARQKEQNRKKAKRQKRAQELYDKIVYRF